MVGTANRRAALRRRYLSLGLSEFATVAVFVYAALRVVVPRLGSDQAVASFLVAAVPPVLFLSQTAAYWLLARTWVEVRSMPRVLARLYRTLQVLDVLVLLAAGVYIAVDPSTTRWAGTMAALVWLFAVVEFTNYYVMRLSYPLGQVVHQCRPVAHSPAGPGPTVRRQRHSVTRCERRPPSRSSVRLSPRTVLTLS